MKNTLRFLLVIALVGFILARPADDDANALTDGDSSASKADGKSRKGERSGRNDGNGNPIEPFQRMFEAGIRIPLQLGGAAFGLPIKFAQEAIKVPERVLSSYTKESQ